MVYPPADGQHPSASWTQCRMTKLIETDTLPLSHATTL